MKAISSWSTGFRHRGHCGFIISSSNDWSKISFEIFLTLSIFQINQHSLQVCWCWHGSNIIDFFLPQPTIHSMLSFVVKFWFSIFFNIDCIRWSTDPLRVILPNSSMLSETSCAVDFFFEFFVVAVAVFLCRLVCAAKQRPKQKVNDNLRKCVKFLWITHTQIH